MTTIAYDGKTLAADRLITHSGRAYGYMTKIAKIAAGVWCAAAGDMQDITAAFVWMRSNIDEFLGGANAISAINHSAIVIDNRSGVRKLYDFDGKRVATRIDDTPVALGSGAAIASGIMHAGLDAITAVHNAGKVCIYSGGGIDYVDLSEAQPKIRRARVAA